MIKMRKTALAAILAAGFTAAPLLVAACPADQAKPFTSGPFDSFGLFSTYVVDSNGVALQTCTDGLDLAGNPPPCFFDPVVPDNALSIALGRGGEAFMFLANSVFTTTGANPVDAVIVMGVETAFLTADGAPAVGFQTQFQRLRTRLNVAAVGHYTVETPWRTTTYTVDTLLPPGNGQNRMEVSDPIDISFGASSSVPGMVTPFLIGTSAPALAGVINPVTGLPYVASSYIGDGLTPVTVTGSPCGTNFVKITAVGLDGITPIDINNGSNVYTEPLFTVMGKKAAQAPVPLSIGAAYYSRKAGATTVSVMAEGSTSATGVATLTVGTASAQMTHDTTRFYGVVPVVGALPATASITATDTIVPSLPNTQSASVKDLVTISSAIAQCSGTGVTYNCTLTVNASSSDDGSGGTAPTLTLQSPVLTPLVNGAASTVTKAVPAAVTVTSTAGGAAVKPVTVINQ